MSTVTEKPSFHRWQPQVPASLFSASYQEDDPSFHFDLPTCRVVPGGPPGSEQYTHHARLALGVSEAEGPVSPESSVISEISRHVVVFVLCKSPNQRLSSKTCTLIPSLGTTRPIDVVSDYREGRLRWGQNALCSVREVSVPPSYPKRSFALPAHTISHREPCTLRSMPDIAAEDGDVILPAEVTCSVDFSFIPAWETSKIPDLGSSFFAIPDQFTAQLPTTADVFRSYTFTDVVTNWSPVSFVGTNGNRTGSIRYVYTLTPRESNSIDIAAHLAPEYLVQTLENARIEASKSLAQAHISLEAFTRLPTSNVDYAGPSVPVLNVPPFDVDGVADSLNGVPRMESYDISVMSQCKFDHVGA